MLSDEALKLLLAQPLNWRTSRAGNMTATLAGYRVTVYRCRDDWYRWCLKEEGGDAPFQYSDRPYGLEADACEAAETALHRAALDVDVIE